MSALRQVQGTGVAQGTGAAQGELRIAVLGVGMMGGYHVEALTNRIRGSRVTVVNDFFADKAEALAASVGARALEDPFEAINDAEVDAVVIASPGPSHDAQVNACLDRGIPVLCEKPLTTDSESAYKIVEKEAALGQSLIQVGFMRRFDAEYVKLKALLDSGSLGAPLQVHCTHRNPDARPEFDSQMMIQDSVVHEVDVTRFLLGSEITSVQVLAGRASSKAPVGFHDPMLVIFETESGALVDVEMFVRAGIGYEVRTEVVAETGTAMIGLDTNMISKTLDHRWGGTIAPGFIERFGAAYDTELQRWVNAAKKGTIDGPGAWDGYAAAAVCEAGVEAVRTGRKVAVAMGPRPAVSARSTS